MPSASFSSSRSYVRRSRRKGGHRIPLPSRTQSSKLSGSFELEVLQMAHYRHFHICATLLMHIIIFTATLRMNNIVITYEFVISVIIAFKISYSRKRI